MRATVRLAQHGNSVRITMLPPVLRFLKWTAGTELQLIVRDEHHIELVDSETYWREKFERERRDGAQSSPVTL